MFNILGEQAKEFKIDRVTQDTTYAATDYKNEQVDLLNRSQTGFKGSDL